MKGEDLITHLGWNTTIDFVDANCIDTLQRDTIRNARYQHSNLNAFKEISKWRPKIAKTADRKKEMDTTKSTDCPKCGKATADCETS